MDVATRKNRAIALQQAIDERKPIADRLVIALSIAEAEGDTQRGRDALERATRYESQLGVGL